MEQYNFLVIGGAGFIGSNMTDYLISNGHNVTIVDNLSTGKKENINPNSTFYNVDIYLEKIDDILSDIDYVIHMGALPNVQQSIHQPLYTSEHNLVSNIKLLNSIRKFENIKKVVFSSTSALYGNPKNFPTDELIDTVLLSPYALQKYCSEQYFKLFSELYNVKSVCLRYFNVFGERMTNEGAYKSVISIFKEQNEKNVPLTITNDGNQKRDFIYVGDVVKANYLACISDTGNFNIYNVGFGENISVNEIASYFNQPTTYIDKRIEPFETLCDNTKIKKDLGWYPTVSVKDWLKKTIK